MNIAVTEKMNFKQQTINITVISGIQCPAYNELEPPGITESKLGKP